MFGQVPMKKQYDCVCPNCQCKLAASRFAPHLEKCMGMGRNSSRLASRRYVCSLRRYLAWAEVCTLLISMVSNAHSLTELFLSLLLSPEICE